MRVQLLPSAVGEVGPQQFCIGVLLNDTVAIDAGCLGFLAPVARQRAVKHVLLSHAHIDHVASLPIFLDNVYEQGADCVNVYASADTWNALKEHVFNDRIWPDLIRLSNEESPFFRLHTLESGRPVVVPPFTITPVTLDHVVPTLGFVVADETSAVAFVSDTGPTREIWKMVNATENLRAVFLEACFPNSLRWLAEKSAHLCPELFATEVEKLDQPVRIIATHLKPAFYDQITRELQELRQVGVEIGDPQTEYVF